MTGRPKDRSEDRHTGPRARTVRGIDDQLWKQVQDRAREQGTSASGVIRELLAQWVTQQRSSARRKPDTRGH